MSDLTIDVAYIGKLSTRLSQFKKVRTDLWTCRCPICGDSKKRPFLKRFFFYRRKGGYSVKCHNCQYALPFSEYLKLNFPDIYDNYMIEKLPNKYSLKKSRFGHIKDDLPKKVICKGFNYSSLKNFADLSADHPARIYTENRKIPLDMVFYVDNFSTFIAQINIEAYSRAYSHAKEPRMIIPFYRQDGLSTVFQARAFSKKEFLRYITIKEDEDESKIYGMERVDISKPVWCTEGPLDSLMIPNAIAMSGLAVKLNMDNLQFVFDNEPRNVDIVKNMRKRLLSGYEVVIFPERMKYKDLNDMIVKGKMSPKRVLDVLNENLYDRNSGLLKLNEWSKL